VALTTVIIRGIARPTYDWHMRSLHADCCVIVVRTVVGKGRPTRRYNHARTRFSALGTLDLNSKVRSERNGANLAR